MSCNNFLGESAVRLDLVVKNLMGTESFEELVVAESLLQVRLKAGAVPSLGGSVVEFLGTSAMGLVARPKDDFGHKVA